MRITTLLNKCYHLKSFVYQTERLMEVDGQDALVIEIVPRKNGRPICSGCNCPESTYDHTTVRLFQFIAIWGFQVYFRYQMRRVDCPRCGVKVERVPWAEGKQQLTKVYQRFLADWAKRLSWLEVARSFRTSWDHVFQLVKMVVEYVSYYN